ncbi:MAG: protein kinase, partial [bacterium]|nr:protein kinase [bacterium]
KGAILGTFQYMAPEQLEAKEVDARTDLFALGALIHEMVTGRKAFEEKTQASLITAIMSAEPRPMSELQPMTPPVLDRVVKRCLEKDPDERWQSAKDLTAELEWVAEGASAVAAPEPVIRRKKSRERLLWAAAVIGSLALAAVAFFQRGPADVQVQKFSVLPPENAVALHPNATPVVSPDGQKVAFVATDDSGVRLIWVRSFDSLTARALLRITLLADGDSLILGRAK